MAVLRFHEVRSEMPVTLMSELGSYENRHDAFRYVCERHRYIRISDQLVVGNDAFAYLTNQ